MCGNLFGTGKVEKPKVETPPATAQVEAVKVPDPTPTQVSEIGGDTNADTKKKQRQRRGFAATRADDRAVLTDKTDTLG